MSNKSKGKGKRFEEYVAKIFREKWNLKKHECHRALSSGTYKVDYSDIVFNPDEYRRPHLIVECKKRASLPANQLLTFSTEFDNWIEQLNKAANKYQEYFDIYPLKLLVFSVDRMRPLVVIDKSQLTKSYLKQRNLKLNKDITKLNYYIKYDNYYSTWLDIFLTECLSLIK